jgi:hypothetical protein
LVTSKLHWLLLTWLLPASVVSGAWQKAAILVGHGNVNSVQIGPGRNDGMLRLYSANGDSAVVEQTYNSAGGSTAVIGSTWDAWLSRVQAATCVAVGVGRYDGVNRVYASSIGNELVAGTGLYEFSWSASQWNRVLKVYTDLLSPSLALGIGRNDGAPRVYQCTVDGAIVEFTYSFGAFAISNVIATPSAVRSISVGDGRGDGLQRVYGANDDGNVYEASFVSGTWTQRVANVVPTGLTSVVIGPGRNDSRQRLYVGCVDFHIYELTSQGSSWSRADLGYAGQPMRAVALGSGRNDGIVRVYAASDDSHLYEFSYTDGSWLKQDLGTGTGAMLSVTVGQGRNDGVVRIYGGNTDANIYEFTYVPEGTNLPPRITAFSNGYLTWTNSQTGAICDIEWAPNLNTNTAWQDNWSSLSGILVTNPVMTVPVPMFYRVKVRTN